MAAEEKTPNQNKAKQSNQSTASQRKIESGDSVNNIALHPDSEALNFGGESKRSGQEESVQCSTRNQEAVVVQKGNTLQNKKQSDRKELLKSGVDVEKTKRNCEEVKLKKKKNWIDKPKCSVNNESINSSECTGIFENESASEKSENPVFSETSDAKPEKDKSLLENVKQVVSLHKEGDTAKASADISTEKVQAQKGGITVECEQSENSVSPKIEIEAQCESGHGQAGKTVASHKDGEKKRTGDLVGAAGGRQGEGEGEGQGEGGGGGGKGVEDGKNESGTSGLETGGQNGEKCKLEDVQVIPAEGKEASANTQTDSSCNGGGELVEEGGQGDKVGEEGGGGGGGKVEEYEVGEVFKKSAQRGDVNASSQAICKNVSSVEMKRKSSTFYFCNFFAIDNFGYKIHVHTNLSNRMMMRNWAKMPRKLCAARLKPREKRLTEALE